jgi:hypothetical protein
VKILFVMDRQLLCNVLFRCCAPLLPSLARRLQFAVALFADHFVFWMSFSRSFWICCSLSWATLASAIFDAFSDLAVFSKARST